MKTKLLVNKDSVNKKNVLTRKQAENTKKNKNHTSGRFFVTSAVAGAAVNTKFLKSIENFCEKENAKLIVLLGREHQAALSKQEYIYANEIYDLYQKGLAVTEYVFNKNLKAFDAQINPQQILPLTGIGRLGISDGKSSIIVASPKQHLLPLATGNAKYPRLLMSTGSLTVPNYQNNRIGKISEQDHVIGGLIVELKKDRFFIRQVQADADGSIISLGKRYFPTGEIQLERAEATVLGDIHAGRHCEKSLNAAFTVFDLVRPKRVINHDLFDGVSISHHLVGKVIERLNRPEHVNSLEKEINTCKNILKIIKDRSPADAKIYIIPSNHNEHLDRYLDEHRYLYDDLNTKLAHQLQLARMMGISNILQYAVDPYGDYYWPSRNDDFFVYGFNLNAHGDIGTNGSRGSPASLEKAYGKVIFGHTHTPSILHKAYGVGTMSLLRQGYNNGPSTWLNSLVNLYAGGLAEQIIIIEGEFSTLIS